MALGSSFANLINRRGKIAILAAFALLILAGAAAVVATISTNAAEGWAAHSLEVRQSLAALANAVTDTETGQRGYLLTNNEDYLTSYTDGLQSLPKLQSSLRALVADNASQVRFSEQLDRVIGAKQAELKSTIELRREGKPEEAIAMVNTNVGRNLMRQIREIVSNFDQAERSLLAERRRTAAIQRAFALAIILGAVLLSGFLGLLVARAARDYSRTLEAQNDALSLEILNRERAETQLRQSQKMDALGKLTGGVAHDFNNMLAIIVGNLDMLLRKLGSGDRQLREIVDRALEGARRAGSLTQRLLAFSRLQPLDPRSTDINKCVGDISEMLRRSLGETITIETVLGGGVWRALIDAPQLESAILNLAVNGRDAMPNGGKLTLETSNAALDQAYAEAHDEVTPGQYVLIAVTDTGHGMTTEIAQKAFDPFFTTKEVGQGTGLGLSQVHGFVKQSGGHIKIYTEVGTGTTIKLYLPRDRSERSIEAPTRTTSHVPLTRRLKIIVVEDEEGVRAFAVQALKEIGFDAIEASTAAMALRILQADQDIVAMLTDVVMPVTDGRKLAAEALLLRPDLRIVYMTGYTRNAIVHNGVLDPGTRLITKPFTIDQLETEMRLLVADIV
jgi:signal transduction histidine kinase